MSTVSNLYVLPEHSLQPVASSFAMLPAEQKLHKKAVQHKGDFEHTQKLQNKLTTRFEIFEPASLGVHMTRKHAVQALDAFERR